MTRLSSVLALAATAVVLPAAAFFAPQPDNNPSLTAGPPMAPPPAPAPPPQPDMSQVVRAAEEQAIRIEREAEYVRREAERVERQAERVERAAERVELQADFAPVNPGAAPINGAFDGQTDERYR